MAASRRQKRPAPRSLPWAVALLAVVLAGVLIPPLLREPAPTEELVLAIGRQERPADPAPSPDGRLIAYQYRNGLWLWEQAARSACSLFLPRDPDYARQPAWAPDGSRLAFQYGGEHGVAIWSVRQDGSGLTALTAPATGVVDSHPAWSADGRTLAFARTVVSPRDQAVWLLEVESGALRRLTPGSEPAWSPDGRTLVVSRPGVEGRRELWQVSLEGQETRLGTGFSPAWSPDGRCLAYIDIRTEERVLATGPGGAPLATVREETQELWVLRQGEAVRVTSVPVHSPLDEKKWAAELLSSGDPTPRTLLLTGRHGDWTPAWERPDSLVLLREDTLAGDQAIYRVKWGR